MPEPTPQIIKNVIIKQHAHDQNEWSEYTLADKELGVVYAPGTKDVRYLTIGDGTTPVAKLIEDDKIFRIGLGADYELPVASSTLLGGIKIHNNYFYYPEDSDQLIPKTFQLTTDAGVGDYNTDRKSEHIAYISQPNSDFKIQGDLYAEDIIADTGIFKNITYEQEINVAYDGQYLKIHKSREESDRREFEIQLAPEHYSTESNEYIYTLDTTSAIDLPEQTITVFQTQSKSIFLGYNMTITKITPNTTSRTTRIEGRVTTDLTITKISRLSLTYTSLIGDSDESELKKLNWSLSNGTLTFSGTLDFIGVHTVESGEMDCNAIVPVDIVLPATEQLTSLEVTANSTTINLSYDAPNSTVTVTGTFLPEYTNSSIIFLDSIITVPVLGNNERAGILIYNYHEEDAEVPEASRRIAELSIDKQGTLCYNHDNSNSENFSQILMLGTQEESKHGLLYITQNEETGLITSSLAPTIGQENLDLNFLKTLTLTLNSKDSIEYSPIASEGTSFNINACTRVIANGQSYDVDDSGLITLGESNWTDDLYEILQSAVQTITFDGLEQSGPTINLKSKIQSITFDDKVADLDDNGNITLTSKIQSIKYNNETFSGPDIELDATIVKNRTVNHGTNENPINYTTIEVDYNASDNSYTIEHYEPEVTSEPTGAELHMIGESTAETSFILMHGLKYDHYGHAQSYSNYELDFSALIARIEALEEKVAALEAQLEAS